jgi:DNA mismatch repair protein MutL
MADDEGFGLTGFISPLSLTRSNRKEMTFFVNGRWIQDTPLAAALLQAYHTMLMVGRYPLAVIFIQVPPEEVDVNVHPAKAEVRFRSPDRIFSFVQRSVRKALLAYTPVPQVVPPALWGRTSEAGQPMGGERQTDAGWFLGHADQANFPPHTPAGDQSSSNNPQSPIPSVPLLRLVGQIGATYLVAEGPDGLYLIDQHAAHERVLFEKLMAGHDRKTLDAQTLLAPVVVHLPPANARLLDEQLLVLEHFGFQVEPFGPDSYQVRAMPALFGSSDPAAALRAIVEDFEEDETPLQAELEARLAGRVCKRMAVKAGQALSPEEQRALLSDLEACASPRTCPHGRPTMIHLSVDMLERQFGRRGAR